MKMSSLIAVLFVVVCATSPVAGQFDELLSSTPTEPPPPPPPPSPPHPSTAASEASSSDSIISKKKSDLIKFGFYDKRKADRGLKPFTFGKKFELQNEFNADRYEWNGGGSKQENLSSHLLKKPIRMLPYALYTSDADKNDENPSKKAKNLLEEIKENFGFEEEPKSAEDATSKDLLKLLKEDFENGLNSRQKGDRSLMVVLPFNPIDNSSVEELFTKRPLIKMIESENFNGKSTETIKDSTIFPVLRENDATATTKFDRKSLLTRKPWRPSKRVRPTTTITTTTKTTTTEVYPTTTEIGDDVTKTYTTYNDAEQVTQKFQVQTKTTKPSDNHNYDFDGVTSRYYNHLKDRFPVPNFGDEAMPSTIRIVPYKKEDGKQEAGFGSRKKILKKFSTTENPSKGGGLKKVLEILPADLKSVMLSLELNKEKNEDKPKPETISDKVQSNLFDLKVIEAPSIDAKSYAVFKPIPFEIKNGSAKGVSEDVKMLLASFGLLPRQQRQQKSLNPERRRSGNEIYETDLNFLPDDMKSVLKEMGVLKIADARQSSSIRPIGPGTRSNVHSNGFVTLESILSTINATKNETEPETQIDIQEREREIGNYDSEESTATQAHEESRLVLNVIPTILETQQTKRATKLEDGPSPLVYAEENLSKNDVKRQEVNGNATIDSNGNSNTTSSSPMERSESSSTEASGREEQAASLEDLSSATEITTTTTTTEENPNIEALRDSFGGGETASDSADLESSLPPKRPNGLYLLLDWNSFFEVGTEDDNRRVNLRFQPKIGDSRNFLPVAIP